MSGMSERPAVQVVRQSPAPEGLARHLAMGVLDQRSSRGGRRRGATLRDTPGLPFYPERMFADSPVRSGARLLRCHPPRRRLARQPQPELFCSGRGLEHRRPAAGDERVLRLDDQHGRSQALPAASIVSKGFTPEGGRPRSRSYVTDEGRAALVDRMLERAPRAASATSSSAIAAPAAAADHLRR